MFEKIIRYKRVNGKDRVDDTMPNCPQKNHLKDI